MNPLEKIGRTVLGKHEYDARSPGISTSRADEERGLGLEARGRQTELADAVRQRALGLGGPSVAEQQMQRGLGQAQSNAASMAASGRGVSRGLAQRNAQLAQGQMSSQANADAGMLRAQEQIAAQQALGQQLQAQRQQDLLARGYSIDEARAVLEAEMKEQSLQMQKYEGAAQRAQGPATAGIAAIGALAASDIEAKENVQMLSDFATKEPLMQPQPQPMGMQAGGLSSPTMQSLNVPELQATDGGVEAAQRDSRSRFYDAMQAGGQASGGGDTGSSIMAGLQLGSMLSDEESKQQLSDANKTIGLLTEALAKTGGQGHPTGLDAVPGGRRGGSAARDGAGDAMVLMGQGVRVGEGSDRGRVAEGVQSGLESAAGGQVPNRPVDGQVRLVAPVQQGVAAARPAPVPAVQPEQAPYPTMAQISDYRAKSMLSDYTSKSGVPTARFADMTPEEAAASESMTDLAAAVARHEDRRDLDPVRAVRYQYKPEHSARMAMDKSGGDPTLADAIYADKRAPRNGIIAQDLEQSPAFADAVQRDPRTGLKAVDMERAVSESLAQTAGLHARLKALENDEQRARKPGGPR